MKKVINYESEISVYDGLSFPLSDDDMADWIAFDDLTEDQEIAVCEKVECSRALLSAINTSLLTLKDLLETDLGHLQRKLTEAK